MSIGDEIEDAVEISNKKHWTTEAIWLLLGALMFASFAFERDNQGAVIILPIVMALGYWGALKGQHSIAIVIVVAVGARLLNLVAIPLLSDDFYRFLWDGELWLAGYHPLDFIPVEAPQSFYADGILRHGNPNKELLENMNSAGYYTVYPPLSQLVFAFAAWMGNTIQEGVTWMKAVIILGELAVLSLLYDLDKRENKAGFIAYALLPLAIIELSGNLHFEGLAVLGILLAIHGFRQNKPWLSGFGLAFGIGVKLVPALIGPALLIAWLKKANPASNRLDSELNYKSSIIFLLSALFFSAVFFVPFFASADLSGFGESLDLYFRSFEFNGSLYVLASALGQWYKGWNWISVIGPSLSILSMLSIITLAVVRGWKKLDLATTLLFSFGIYILCATTVHPWYAIYLVALAPLTKYKWPYVLGFTVFLSYLAYGTEDVVVPIWATVIEYSSVLAILIYELNQQSSEQVATTSGSRL
ncbi:MAG: glycosyltransferase 87 family protein [Saprospiraceae bacterium]